MFFFKSKKAKPESKPKKPLPKEPVKERVLTAEGWIRRAKKKPAR